MAILATDYTRTHCLALIAEYSNDAFESQRALLIKRHFDDDPDRFMTALGNELTSMRLPEVADLVELLELLRDTSAVPYDLGYEDKQYLAEVRTHLVDAFVALCEGDIDVCAMALERASDRLDFITYKRRRQDKRDYHNPFAAMKPAFERLTMRTTALARRIGTVAVSA